MDRFVAEVEAGIAELLSGPAPCTLRAAAGHLCLAEGAKRARPRLVHAFGQAVGAKRERLVEIALAAELIHSASLLHDDVVDAGTVRRGRPTANATFGNHTAVLAGDLLLSFALGALRAHPRETVTLAVDVVAAMTRAAIGEVEARGDASLSYLAWREIAVGKTGVLFAFCGAAPALVTGDEEAVRRFAEVGDRLGVAFQLADDLHDRDPGRGKDAFADLRQRNPSSLLAIACARSSGFRDALAAAWDREAPLEDDEVAELAAQLDASGAPRALGGLLQEEIEGALLALGPYRERPGAADIEGWARALAASARLHSEA